MLASAKPKGAPSCGIIAYQPRRFSGALRLSNEASPSQAPPSAKPWPSRKSASSATAPVADRLVTRQEGDGGGGAAKDDQCHRQLGAAAVVAVDPHEDEGADRTGEEGEGEEREGHQRRGDGAAGNGEDQLRENEDGSEAVNEEIEEFGGAPDHHADGDTAGRQRLVVRMHAAGIPLETGGRRISDRTHEFLRAMCAMSLEC